jgi:hypothetical protein
MALKCDKPTRRKQSTILIMPFSPIPNSLEFPLGKSQFFISKFYILFSWRIECREVWWVRSLDILWFLRCLKCSYFMVHSHHCHPKIWISVTFSLHQFKFTQTWHKNTHLFLWVECHLLMSHEIKCINFRLRISISVYRTMQSKVKVKGSRSKSVAGNHDNRIWTPIKK